jgi:hypothetical protein
MHAEAKLRPVMDELSFCLESTNPVFSAVLLKVFGARLALGLYWLAVAGKLSQ